MLNFQSIFPDAHYESEVFVTTSHSIIILNFLLF